MKMALLAALASLDVGNDNHWTAEGLPRLDTVKFLTGDAGLTRDAVTAAAPTLTRATPLQAAQPGSSDTGSGHAPKTQPAPAQVPAQPLPKYGDGHDEQDDLASDFAVEEAEQAEPQETALAAAQRAYNDAVTARAQADKVLAEASAEVDRLIEEDEKARAAANAGSPVQDYLKHQRKLLQERGERIKQLKKVDLADILPKRAPLDDAMRRKTARFGSRPKTLR